MMLTGITTNPLTSEGETKNLTQVQHLVQLGITWTTRIAHGSTQMASVTMGYKHQIQTLF